MSTWILSWDDLGLEAVVNWSQKQSDFVEAALKEGHADNPVYDIINMLQLRARFNPHRHPEIWAVDIDDNMDEKLIREFFESSPNEIKELIRAKGKYKIW